jgi:hypothetical protein
MRVLIKAAGKDKDSWKGAVSRSLTGLWKGIFYNVRVENPKKPK